MESQCRTFWHPTVHVGFCDWWHGSIVLGLMIHVTCPQWWVQVAFRCIGCCHGMKQLLQGHPFQLLLLSRISDIYAKQTIFLLVLFFSVRAESELKRVNTMARSFGIPTRCDLWLFLKWNPTKWPWGNPDSADELWSGCSQWVPEGWLQHSFIVVICAQDVSLFDIIWSVYPSTLMKSVKEMPQVPLWGSS